MIDHLGPEQHFFLYFYPLAIVYVTLCFGAGYPLLSLFSRNRELKIDLAAPVGFAATVCIAPLIGVYGLVAWFGANGIFTILQLWSRATVAFKNNSTLKRIAGNLIKLFALLLFAYFYLWPHVQLSSRNENDEAFFIPGDAYCDVMLLAQEIKSPGVYIHAPDFKYHKRNDLQKLILATAGLFGISPSDGQNRLINPVVCGMVLYCLGMIAIFISGREVSLWLTPLLLYTMGNICFAGFTLIQEFDQFNLQQIARFCNDIIEAGYDPFLSGYYLYSVFTITPMFDLFGVSLILTGLVIRLQPAGQQPFPWQIPIILGILVFQVIHPSTIALAAAYAISTLFLKFRKNAVSILLLALLCFCLIWTLYADPYHYTRQTDHFAPFNLSSFVKGILTLGGYPHFWLGLGGLIALLRAKKNLMDPLTVTFLILVPAPFVAAYMIQLPGDTQYYPMTDSITLLIAFSAIGMMMYFRRKESLAFILILLLVTGIPNLAFRLHGNGQRENSSFKNLIDLKPYRDLATLEARNRSEGDRWIVLRLGNTRQINWSLESAVLQAPTVFMNGYKPFAYFVGLKSFEETAENWFQPMLSAKNRAELRHYAAKFRGTGVFYKTDQPIPFSEQVIPTDTEGRWAFYRL